MAEMVNFNLANPYQAQLDALARRQQMADIMAQQAYQPMQTPGTYNGIQAPISHLSGLAKILEGYTAGKEERAIKEERQKLGETYRSDQSADFTNLARMLAAPAVAGQAEIPARQAEIAPEEMAQSADYGTPLPGAAIPAVQARRAGQIDPEMIGKFKTPETQQMAMAQLLAQIGPEKLTEVGKGASLYSPRQGKVVFTAPNEQEFGTTPQYEKDDKSPTGFVAVLYGKNGERKVVGPANPMNQYTTGTVDAALKRDMDMYQFGNLSAEQKASLGIKLTQAGIDITRLGFETGQGPAPQPRLPQNAPVPNFGVQTQPPAMPQTAIPQTVAPQVQPQVRPQTSPNVRPVQAAMPTAQERPAGVTPKAWAEIQAKQAEAQFEKTKGAKTVVGLLTGVEDLIDQAHGGFFGNVYGGAKAALSMSDPANSADSQLNVIAGALTSQMPKMSGPQSDKDVLLYKQMAGDIGNPNISAEAKKAAVETVRGIQNAYINGFSETGYLPKGRASVGTIRNVEPPAGAVRRIK
jgi:hypothetical protein